MPGVTRGLAPFVGVSFIYLLIMAATTVPTPLYPFYQQRMHFSLFMGTVIFAIYVVGVLAGLLGFGRWSDALGRRPMLGAAVVMGLISTVCMLASDVFPSYGLPILLVGRLFVGLAVGLFVGAATAALIELAPPAIADKAPFISTAVNVLGLGSGPLLAGVMMETVPPPLRSVYWVLLAGLLIAALIVWRMPETVSVKPGARPQAQSFSLPAGVSGPFIQAAVPGFAGFAALGLFGAVSPDLMRQMGIADAIEQGLVIFAVFAASCIAQLVVKPLPLARTMVAGCAILTLGAAVLLLSVLFESWVLLLAGGVISGAGQGATFAKGLAHVSGAVADTERAGVTSVLFVCFYLGLTVPAVGVGALALEWGLTNAAAAFAVVMMVLAAGAWAINRSSLAPSTR
ncbi:MFS transporter [Pseudochelatococcus contaminans]|uniref:MFS family permease n=1 Tax=Pseudochelatococcus contaminans TaxID=1538103 RepID=A0A7W5Z305_9HYPH|nr:MFS transporter [Pseudochelatococcus contaminans]MBB3809186.1 MFS family permease [Pseudochelatococcus contaminans]